jgi:PAS domain S-box-containing protein
MLDEMTLIEIGRLNNKLFEKIYSVSHDAICITTIDDGMIISVNDNFATLSGLSKESLVGRTTLELKLWSVPTDRENVVKILMKEKCVADYETAFQTTNGMIVGSFSASLLEINGITFVVSSIKDITVTKQISEAFERISNKKDRSQNYERNVKLLVLATILGWLVFFLIVYYK